MHFRSLVLFFIVALVVAPVATVGAQAEARYTLTDAGVLQVEGVDLPTLRCSGLRGTVADINDDGQVVGFWPKDEQTGSGFFFDGKKLKRLKSESGFGSEPNALNNEGTIVGVVYQTEREDVCARVASPWPAQWIDGKLSRLELPPDAVDGIALDINENGVIAGSYGTGEGIALPVAWIDGAVVQLSLMFDRDLKEVGNFSRANLLFETAEATTVDEDGNLYGYGGANNNDGEFVYYAVKWLAGDLKLTVIGSVGTQTLRAGAGFYVGGTALDASQTDVAVVFGDEGEIILPAPADLSGITASSANQSSVDGSVIVGSISTGDDRDAYLWDTGGGDPANATTINLNDVVENLGSFHLERATGINANGQIAVIGSDDATGLMHALILEPIAS